MEFETRGDFDLARIGLSGQVFNWKAEGDGFIVPSGQRLCRAVQHGDRLVVTDLRGGDSESEAYWLHYFALDVDYQAILSHLRLDPDILDASRGIRVLNQWWWDAAVAFIISQNSNIPRIRSTVERLSDEEGRILNPKPLIDLIADDACGMGYRQAAMLQFASAVADGWHPRCLDAACALGEQMEQLQTFRGIGPKVAACICLFGLGFVQAVPRDTWIKRAEQQYGIVWDERYGGIQQQYVFHWIRTKNQS